MLAVLGFLFIGIQARVRLHGVQWLKWEVVSWRSANKVISILVTVATVAVLFLSS